MRTQVHLLQNRELIRQHEWSLAPDFLWLLDPLPSRPATRSYVGIEEMFMRAAVYETVREPCSSFDTIMPFALEEVPYNQMPNYGPVRVDDDKV